MKTLSWLKNSAVNGYYNVAKRPPFARIHNALRRRSHRRRYGVDSAFMFHAVELEVNSMCNRKCGYCPNSFARRPAGYMDEALFRKIVDELGAMDYDGRISYHFYGEPLIDKRLPDFVEYTKRRVPKSYTEIYSNGDLLTLPIYREYLRRGLDNMLITQHDSLITPNLQEILDSVTEEEQSHLVIRLAKDRELINRSGLIRDLQVVGEPLRVPCTWPLSILVITMRGDVVLCCNDYFETEVIGSVETHSLRTVWTNPKFVAFREALARGDRTVSRLCHECDFIPPESQLLRIIPDIRRSAQAGDQPSGS